MTHATAADSPEMSTKPKGMIHISFSLAGVREKATCASQRSTNDPNRWSGRTLENSSAGVKSETLRTFSLRWVALSVTPARERTYPAMQSRKTSKMDWRFSTASCPIANRSRNAR